MTGQSRRMSAVEAVAEEWRPVDGWPYEVSNLGRVRRSVGTARIGNTWPGRVLRPQTMCRDNYLGVHLKDAPRSKLAKIHRLVALAFHGPQPSERHEVAHSDGDRANNIAANLRWATAKENCADTARLGRTPRGTRHGMHKLSEAEVLAIRRRYAAGGCTQKQLATEYGITQPRVSAIVLRTLWAWLEDAA